MVQESVGKTDDNYPSRVAKMVAGLIGYEHAGSDEDLRELSKIVPLIRLVPLAFPVG